MSAPVYVIYHRRRKADDRGKACDPYVEVQVRLRDAVVLRCKTRAQAEAWIDKQLKETASC